MASFKLGTLEIPVYKHVELTGEPVANPTINILDLIPVEMFGFSVEIGNGTSESTYQNPDAQGNTSNVIAGGVTGIHGAEVVFDVTARSVQSNKYGPYLDGNILVRMVEGETSIQIDRSTITVNNQMAPRYLIAAEERKAFAISFNYPDAAAEKDRVKGYRIFTVRNLREWNPVTGNLNADQYTFDTSAIGIINIPYYNKSRDLSLYYDEEPEPGPDEPPFDPTEDPEPYDPSKDDTSDLVNIPGNPLIGVTSAGFINVYNPGISALQGLGDILFPNVASATDIVEAVLKLCETLANSNLINYVIDCHIIPVQPQIGVNASIKVGFRDTGISVPRVTNDYIDATCGSLNIREYFGGFQDFLATRSKLYLPFIGFVDVRPEYWQGGTLSVDYKFNVIDGSFMCYVRSVSSKSQLNGSVIAQYAGNACLHLPVTGVNYAQMVSGIVGAAVTMASGGGSSAVLGGALSAANTIAAGGNVQQSNGYSSTAALMGVRTPFLLIERAVPAYSAKYAHDKGFPTNIATLLSNVTGYTEISDIDLTGLPFTADEITELRQLLAEGVYF